MLNHKIVLKIITQIIIRIGSFYFFSIFLVPFLLWAADIKFSAQVDRNKITLEDQISLQFFLESDSMSRLTEPKFRAPDFQIVNEFNSMSVSSQYDSTAGGFSMVNQQQITKILKPLKTGTLKISNIEVQARGKVLQSPDISIQVVAVGHGSLGSSGGSSGNLNSPPIQLNSRETDIFVRAEVNKNEPYKGEQIVVSYYLYHLAKVFNLQVSQFPVFKGFLREDLEIPVMTQRLESETIQIKGKLYQRSLLAKYAAYPIEEGELTIDPIGLKYNYYFNSRKGLLNQDDPLFGFFQQLAPQSGNSRSEPVTIHVNPLPEQGRPLSFTGGIGEFNVTDAVNRYEVRANEALVLTVNVEGKGNINTLQQPKVQWPAEIELYEAKGRTQSYQDGGSRVFEFLLIPRKPGKFKLPSVEVGFFNPKEKQYYVQSTDEIEINVLEPLPGTELVPPSHSKALSVASNLISSTQKKKQEDLRYIKPPIGLQNNLTGLLNWRYLYWGFFTALSCFLIMLGRDWVQNDLFSKNKKMSLKIRKNSKVWARLHARARDAGGSLRWQEVSESYELLTEELLTSIEVVYLIEARSISRAELGQLLVQERGLSPEVWNRIVKLFEFADLVKFASSIGATSENQVRSQLNHWVQEGEKLIQELGA